MGPVEFASIENGDVLVSLSRQPERGTQPKNTGANDGDFRIVMQRHGRILNTL